MGETVKINMPLFQNISCLRFIFGMPMSVEDLEDNFKTFHV